MVNTYYLTHAETAGIGDFFAPENLGRNAWFFCIKRTSSQSLTVFTSVVSPENEGARNCAAQGPKNFWQLLVFCTGAQPWMPATHAVILSG
jgi:hypothetical protein